MPQRGSPGIKENRHKVSRASVTRQPLLICAELSGNFCGESKLRHANLIELLVEWTALNIDSLSVSLTHTHSGQQNSGWRQSTPWHFRSDDDVTQDGLWSNQEWWMAAIYSSYSLWCFIALIASFVCNCTTIRYIMYFVVTRVLCLAVLFYVST